MKHFIWFSSCIQWCTGFDLPQINYGSYNGKKYSFAYGLSIDWTAVSLINIIFRLVMPFYCVSPLL